MKNIFLFVIYLFSIFFCVFQIGRIKSTNTTLFEIPIDVKEGEILSKNFSVDFDSEYTIQVSFKENSYEDVKIQYGVDNQLAHIKDLFNLDWTLSSDNGVIKKSQNGSSYGTQHGEHSFSIVLVNFDGKKDQKYTFEVYFKKFHSKIHQMKPILEGRVHYAIKEGFMWVLLFYYIILLIGIFLATKSLIRIFKYFYVL